MKTAILLGFVGLSTLAFSHVVVAQGTAFTYQGRLQSGDSPAGGFYDFIFSLYATNTGGVAIAGPVTNTAVGVTNGLFTTTLQFGNVFIGGSNWLQIAVSSNGANLFTSLSPRQQLTPVPYAISAGALSGTLPASQLTGTIASNELSGAYSGAVTFNNGGNQFGGTFIGNGSLLSNLNSGALVLSSTNNVIVAWGLNDSGQTTIPTGLGGVTTVSAGYKHSLALLANGTVAAWGAGLTNDPSDFIDYGQAIVPAGLSNVVAVAAGAFHSAAVKNDGTVVAWGRGDSGQTNVPGGLNSVQAISASEYCTLALKANGTVVAWGSNNFGQLNIPPGLAGVKMVSAGLAHCLALESNGTVVAWGAGLTNNPSDGIDFGQAIVPAGLSNVIAIAAGGVHSLALKADGTLVAWGAGLTNNPSDGFDYGQASVPPGLSKVADIVAGFEHSLALGSNGSVVVWGNTTLPPVYLDNAFAVAPGCTAQHELALRRLSDAPVAWLDSDNTFNGNIQVNGVLNAAGGLTMGGDLRLNGATLWLRGGNDTSNGLRYGGFGAGGPALFGQSGGALGTVATNGTSSVALSWNNSQQVGIGTAYPAGRLDLGGDAGNAKLLLQGGGGPSLGANGSQLIFNLGGGSRFSFVDSPGGKELVSIVETGDGYGSIGVDTTSPNGALDVRGIVRLGSSGQYYAPGGNEDLYIIRGVVASTGAIVAGTGFTVTKGATGFFTVNFTNAFSATPAVVVTPQSGINRIATCTLVSTTSAGIWTRDTSGTATDNQFDFIAIGPK
ncbi:Alpha-tubulin suppressor and related RCC1 domain-containing protein-like protein (modular protein) [Verrucomicrobia bacterium]|nr:Alpha-tubulin suppressor and related RCC1 domain-containing protein-like protein (modular protein) [Verrucomicrobiota bacterium]